MTQIWDTDDEWNAAQASENIEIGNGLLSLVTSPYPLRIDDVEDGDLAEYSGDTADFSTTTTAAFSGSYAVEMPGQDQAQIIYSQPGGGLGHYTQPGDTFEARFQFTSSGERELGYVFGVQDASNFYRLEMDDRDGSESLTLYINEGGTYTELASVAVSGFPTSEWLRLETTWHEDGSFTISAFDASGTEIANLTATDTTYTDGGFGWFKGSAGSTGYGDAAQITSSTTRLLPPLVVDDFEDGDIAEYTHDTGAYTTQTATVANESVGLESTATDTRNIASYSGLDYYPKAGDTFRWWGRPSGTGFILFGFAAQEGTGGSGSGNAPDGYYSWMDVQNGAFKLREKSGGNSTTIASTAFSWDVDTWYEVRVTWAEDGTLTATLFDVDGVEQAEISATDVAFVEGGVVWLTNGSAYMDHARITSSTTRNLPYWVDNFEDTDLAEYSDWTGAGLTAFGVDSTSPVTSGDYSLKGTDGGSIVSYEGDGLTYYPQPGDVIEYDAYAEDGTYGRPTVYFGVPTGSANRTGYSFLLHIPDNLVRLIRWDDGSSTTLAETAVTLSTNTVYSPKIDWGDDGTIAVEVTDPDDSIVATVSATDSAYTSRGIGIHSLSTATTMWDKLRVTDSLSN